MLLQKAGEPGGTLPPPGFAVPNWELLKEQWSNAPQANGATVKLGPARITLGHDDFEEEDSDPEKTTQLAGHEFGWDNEHPRREVEVEEFRISWRPISNGEFYEFWRGDGQGRVKLPASWIEIDGEVQAWVLLLCRSLSNRNNLYRSALCTGPYPCHWLTIGLSSHLMTTCRRTRW